MHGLDSMDSVCNIATQRNNVHWSSSSIGMSESLSHRLILASSRLTGRAFDLLAAFDLAGRRGMAAKMKICVHYYGAVHLSTTTCVQPPNRQVDQIEFSNL